MTQALSYIRIAILVAACGPAVSAMATELSASDVLVLVNANSPCSKSVADLYRRYHPDITAEQVLYLGGVSAYPAGLPDSAAPSAGPASEIITRDQFEKLIAQPVRDYLIAVGRVDTTYCIITTAGMPYRIKDSAYSNVVYPAGSDPNQVLNNVTYVDAAAVESELAVLWQIDPALAASSSGCPTCPGLPTRNRAVNPYQGYRSGIKSWANIRETEGILSRRHTFNWVTPRFINKAPLIEGQISTPGSATGRRMSPADIYLVARLDGPRAAGTSPIFAVRDMLERAAAVSDPGYPMFVGYNPAASDLVIDESAACCNGLQCMAVYNLRTSALTAEEYTIDFNGYAVPPGGEDNLGSSGTVTGCHHDRAMQWLTGVAAGETLLSAPMSVGLGFGGYCLWEGTNAVMNSGIAATLVGPGRGIMGLLTYGCNGDDGRPQTYLLSSGPGGGRLFDCAPGAVFSSLESYNAVTMFSGQSTGQGKIIDFIQIGGTAAVGNAFEPLASGLIQGDYLFRNLLRDDDGDGVGDLTLAEASCTATPFLSWASVVIGDPLMRLRRGPGGVVRLTRHPGDTDADGFVGYVDLFAVYDAFNTSIGEPMYSPNIDFDQDGFIGYNELFEVYDYFGTSAQ